MYYFLYFSFIDYKQYNVLLKSTYILDDTFFNKTDVACVVFNLSGTSSNLYAVSAF